MEELEWSQHFSHYKSMVIFPEAQGQLTPQSLVPSGQISNSLRDVMDALVTCKNEEYPIKNEGAKSGHKIFPIITVWLLPVAMETRVLIRSGPKPYAAFPPNQ